MIALLFAGEYYYPAGGWNDLVDSFETVEAAKAAIDGTRRMVEVDGYWHNPRRRDAFDRFHVDDDGKMVIGPAPVIQAEQIWVPPSAHPVWAYDWAQIVVDGLLVKTWREGHWSQAG